QRRLLVLRPFHQQGTELRGGGEQDRRLALDDALVVGLAGVRAVEVHQLQHLALGDGIGGVGQQAHHRHAVQDHHQLERARIEEITDQDAGGIAEHRIGGTAAAAHAGFVHHVIVQQRGRMDELDDGGGRDVVVAAVAGRTGRQQRDQRAQALAAGNDVLGHLVDQEHLRLQPGTDQRIDAAAVLGGQRLYVGEVTEGGGAGRGGKLCGQWLRILLSGRRPVTDGDYTVRPPAAACAAPGDRASAAACVHSVAPGRYRGGTGGPAWADYALSRLQPRP